MGGSKLKSLLYITFWMQPKQILIIVLSNVLVRTFSVGVDQFSGCKGYCNVLLIQLLITVGLTVV